jgi:hypothetical protein
VDTGRQRDRAPDLRLGTDHRLRDLARGLIDDRVVVRLESNSDPMLVSHCVLHFVRHFVGITYYVLRTTTRGRCCLRQFLRGRDPVSRPRSLLSRPVALSCSVVVIRDTWYVVR